MTDSLSERTLPLDGTAPASLAARVREHAQRAPDSAFCTLITGGSVEDICFGQLYRRGLAYAGAFERRGVGKGDIVPIILRHGPHLFYAFLGALLAGAVPSFMPFPSSKQRIDVYWHDHDRLFDRLRPRMVVTYSENAASAAEFLTASPEILVANDALLDEPIEDIRAEGLFASVDDVACLQHSSGTTGLKKGVMLSHRAVSDHVSAYARVISFGPSDRIASWLPLYHDMGFIACFMMSMLEGAHLVALDPFEWVMRPVSLLEAIAAYRATFCWLPNFAFSHIVRMAKAGVTYDLHSIRAIISCSEPCKEITFRRFLERFADSGIDQSRLGVSYAMAEDVFAVTQTEIGKPVNSLTVNSEALTRGEISLSEAGRSQSIVSCGTPIKDTKIRVCNPQGEPVAERIVGEIYVSSPFLFSGYYLQPELTARKLIGGWYSTGDLGFTHSGELYVTGRIDDMIVINGRNHYAHEIELLVSDVDGVLPGRAIALAIDDAASDATVIVVLAECHGGTANARGIGRRVKEEVQDRLGIAVRSVLLVVPGSLAKTTSGKMSRVKNKEMFLAGAFEKAIVP